jgi:Putative adhesin
MRHERFDTPGPLRLDLSVPAGEIDVRTHDGAETTVDLEPLRGNDASREAIESARIQLRGRAGDAQELVVEVPGSRGLGGIFSRGPEVQLVVHCPAGAELEAEAGSADIRAAGRYGSVEARSGSGDVEVAEVDGAATVKTGSGDVALDRVEGELSAQTGSGDIAIGRAGGRATLRSASGDVAVRDAATDLTAQTASGDVSVQAVSAGELSIQSASGDVSVGVRPGRRLWVDASSTSGETTSDFEVGDEPAPGEGEEEGPLVELRIATMSGDVHVARAAAADLQQ